MDREKEKYFATRNLPLDWLVWYDYYNQKLRSPNYQYGYNVQTARYFQDSTYTEDQGLIKFGRNTNLNLIPVDPTPLREVYTRYVNYPSENGKSTTVPYNNLMVRKNFDKDIYYIGNGSKYLYWNVFPDEEKYSRFVYYLSTVGEVPTSFKNLYYDFSYDENEYGQYEDKGNNNNKNSLEIIDLNSDDRGFLDFYSHSRKNERENPTREFLDVRDFSRDDSSTGPLRFDFATGDRTYKTAFAATRQSRSTVRTRNCPNSNIYFCSMCTVDLLGTVTNSRNCPLSRICPRCTLRFSDGGKIIFRKPTKMKYYENGNKLYRTKSPQRIYDTQRCEGYKNSVINDNYNKIHKTLKWSSYLDEEKYLPAYAFSTEAKKVESSDTSKISSLLPEKDPKVQNNSRNKNLKLNIIPDFKNNNVVNITDGSSYSNLNFSDEYGHVDPNNSIMRITKQVRENIKSAKEDFDNFIRRTDEQNKFKENFKNDDIILELKEKHDVPREKKLFESKSPQIFDENMTSIRNNIDDEEIEKQTSCTEAYDVTSTRQNDTAEDTYAAIDVPDSTKNLRTPEVVESGPTYDTVERSNKVIMSFQQEKHDDGTYPKIIPITDLNKGSNNTKITSKEDDYKKILLSIISSLNNLDISDNNNDQATISENSFDIDNQLSDKIDVLSDINDITSILQQDQVDPPEEPSSSDSSTSSSSSSSSSSKSSSSSSIEQAKSILLDKHTSKLSDSKICSQALNMIKFLGTLNMKKLDLKHEPRLRRATFLEWISQLEIAFSSNKYTRTILTNYSTSNKINLIADEKIDLLVYTVIYAFLDKATRISTSSYKNKGTKLLKVLHMKCASIDAQTKLRAKMAFNNCRISNEENAINFLTRLEQKANEARNFDIKISEKRFIWTLLNNMKFHRHYKERIASFLTAFELDKNSITQKWIENKFYSMDEERMSFHRQRLFKESARFTSSNSTQTSRSSNKGHNSNKKIIRCKYCYRSGHTDEDCLDKKQKRPPSMPAWISKTTCMNCKKKGHLAFNCPPKYACKIIRPKAQKFKYNNKTTANNVKDEINQAPKINEFAGMVTSQPTSYSNTSRPRQRLDKTDNH